MEAAVKDVASGRLSCKRAALEYNVPRSTLQRKLEEYKSKQHLSPTKLGSFRPIFSAAQEEELASYIKDMEGRLFGLSPKEVRQLAYQLATKNNIPHNFDPTTQTAGEDWLANFLKRNSSLSLRKPEATSAARAMGFNRQAVEAFFKILIETVDKYKITADKIYNVDETGMTTVAKSLGKVVATKGRKQVGSLSSAERGQLFTVEICMSATGVFMPPMFIFPRQRLKPELMDGAPPNSWAECNEKGWITKEIFLKWFNKFVTWSRATQEQPVLLLLDGHASHVKNLELIDIARSSGVHIICFPPHCTHRLQPLDVSFMKPLSAYYGEEVKKWLRSNPGRVVTHYQVATLFCNAFLKSATMLVAINGFRKTGIWPINPDIFGDEDFLPADTTDLPMDDVIVPQSSLNQESQPQPLAMHNPTQSSTGSLTQPNIEQTPVSPSPGPSTMLQLCATPPPGTSFHVMLPLDIMPKPKARVQKRVTRKRGKTALITSSPYKKDIEEAQIRKPVANEKQGRKKKTKKIEKNKENESEEEDAECLYCGNLYSESTEGWVTCRACQRWAHCSCAGEEDNDDESLHICTFCARF